MIPVLKPCEFAGDYFVARELFQAYAGGLGVPLAGADFERELSLLPQLYGPPGGGLLIAYDGPLPVGCVGIRRFSDDTCELLRLYVTPERRSGGVGRRLVREAIATGRRLGYRRMVLDTPPGMEEARALCRSLGFHEIPPYYDGLPGSVFMERTL